MLCALLRALKTAQNPAHFGGFIFFRNPKNDMLRCPPAKALCAADRGFARVAQQSYKVLLSAEVNSDISKTHKTVPINPY